MNNNVLIIGSGGREHALAWKLKQSSKVEKIFIAPGNPGTAGFGINIDIKPTDFNALIEFAKKENIALTVVGPDDPLALGIVNAFQDQNLKIWGPTRKAAQIEASKAFSKELMKKNRVPTANFETFHEYKKALEYLDKKGTPIVIKASGLALGKGVTVCQNLNDAKDALKKAMVDKVFGDAGSVVVIEEFLEGVEFSTHAFCDGSSFSLLPASQDHKPVFNDDKGPNTGGMGTIAPLPWVDQNLMNEVAERIVRPMLDGMKKDGMTFEGLLYPGLMAVKGALWQDSQRAPLTLKVIEFNARFGDPETQSYMRLLKTDLFDILTASVNGDLESINIEWENKYACCIVLASGGYPGSYKKSLPITGIEKAEEMDNVVVFHAGTANKDKNLVTNGGRVLGVTAIDDNLQGALDKAYKAVKLIHFEGMHFRTDIGAKSVALTKN